KAATSTIPVVAFMLDPLQAGLVTSLGRPGGNLTGITLDAGIENWGKRLQLLKEAIPSTAKAAFLGMREGWEGSSGQVVRDAADLAELLRRMADDVHQILKGAKPGDIPIYQPTKFELLINLKTAKALDLSLPSALLAHADQVIE